MNLNEWTTLRKTLLPYAYNILGSIDDSQDVLQNVLIKAQGRTDILNERAYLIKAVINESITFKKRRDKSIDQKVWLPQPFVTNDGEVNVETKEILHYSMLVLMESLTIKERAVFLLKEAFSYTHEEIGDVLYISAENSRQLLARAKKKLKARKPDAVKPASQNLTQLEQYIVTIREGDIKTLETMLAEEVQVLADGGSNLNVVAELTSGISATIDLVMYVYHHYQKKFDIVTAEVNHQPALFFYKDKKLVNCQVFEIDSNNKIKSIFSVIDPLKLADLPNT
ncbi:sigma factor-like helix-turn-helix DNA-binding protein [Albibacterium indicum]|uniref:sigma factor-like helix-turn-helix DNA-binding protein n=1 Tax=Albibacterium indicum TaxID=2292082 RepID=UPI000E502549|nr:sigma factor-like helix-turn-helix DNA-binding protein [Pedobacter indicus]